MNDVCACEYVHKFNCGFGWAVSQPPDVTNNPRRAAAADRLGRYGIIGQTVQPTTSLDDPSGTLSRLNGPWKVSAKIQQLLNTLKRPKRRPLPEFYEDDDIELELAANPKDPNAPKPEGFFLDLFFFLLFILFLLFFFVLFYFFATIDIFKIDPVYDIHKITMNLNIEI